MADNTTNNKIVTTVELDVNKAAQEIVKLNSLASDGTKDLSERLDAKNKQIKIQNDLNKKGISDLEKQVKGLKGVVGKEKEYIKATQKLEKAKLNEVKVTERNAKTQRKLAASYDKSKGAINKLDNATGGMITRLKALAANPIVLFVTLLVGALSLLKKAFTSSEEGQNRWNKAMAVVDAVLGNLLDLVADLANVLVDLFSNPKESLESFGELIKQNLINRFDGLLNLIPELGRAITLLFDGEFSEAGKVAGNAVAKVALGVDDLSGKIEKATEATKGFLKEQNREAKLAAQVADKRAKADKIERQLLVSRSVLEAKIAQKRLDAKKENEFTSKQRKAFLEEAQKLEDQLIDKETKYLELRRDAQILENTFSRSNKENLDAEAKAIAAVNDQQAVRAKKAKKLQTELNTITKEIERDNKVISDAKKKKQKEEDDAEEKAKKLKKEKELEDAESDRNAQLELDEIEIQRKRDLGERTLALELELLEKKRLQDVSAAGLTAKEIEVINAKSQKAKSDIKDKEEKTDKAVNKAILDSGINMAADAFGIAQEVAVAKMLMAAPEAIGNVWSQAAKQPTIPQMLLHGTVGTVTTVAPIVKGLKDIKKTRFSKKKGGSGGGGGSISTSAGSASRSAGVSDISNLAESNASRLGTDSSLSSRASADAVNSSRISATGSGVVFSENAYSNFQSQISFREDKTTLR
tara:strand:+ start:11393 stop:13483 length:2091 start_codon:yes stop_codon:yes gene_type:complete